MFNSPQSTSQSTSAAAAMEFKSSGVLVSEGTLAEYDVLKAIGKGKFSVVYRASRKSDGRLVAVKKVAIVDIMDKKTREKTLKEVKLLQSLKHPNVVAYLDAFLDGDAQDGGSSDLIIVLEWAEAGDLKRQLRKAIQKHARFEERIIWRYFSQIADAIGYMHSQRIMHRDLKPANIFLMADGTIKVGDLGLSRSLSENTLQAHSKVGTPLYMSPEVLRGNGYDFKSDVWSLGCILYELSSLKSPFKEEGLNLYGLFQKINKGTYPPIPQPYSKTIRLLVRDMLMVDVEQRAGIVKVVETAKAMRIETEQAKQRARAAARAQQKGHVEPQKQGGGQQRQQMKTKVGEDSNNEVKKDQTNDDRERRGKRREEKQNNQDEIETNVTSGSKTIERSPNQSPDKPIERISENRPQSASRRGRSSDARVNVIVSDRMDIQPKTNKRLPRPNSAARRGRPASARRKRPDAVNEVAGGPVRAIRSDVDESKIGQKSQLQQDNVRISPEKGSARGESSTSNSPNISSPDVGSLRSTRPVRKEKAMSARHRRDQLEAAEQMQILGGGSGGGGGVGGNTIASGGTAETNAITLMDMSLDKLEMINYRELYLKPRDIMHAFTPMEFALLPKDNRRLHELSASFMNVIHWLLNDCMKVSWEMDEMQTSLHNARDLLSVLTNRCRMSPDMVANLSPSDVAKGCGHACCSILNYVLDCVLEYQGQSSLAAPKYNDAEAVVEEIGNLEGVKNDRGDDVTNDRKGGSGRVGGAQDDIDENLSENEDEQQNSDDEMYGGGIRRGPDAALSAPWDLKQLFSMADDETRNMWRVECERVGPALQRVNKELKRGLAGSSSSVGTSSAWRMHLNTLKHHLRSIKSTKIHGSNSDDGNGSSGNQNNNSSVRGIHLLFESPNQLPWAVDLIRLNRGEPMLKNVFGQIQDEYEQIIKRSKTLQKTVDKKSSKVSEYSTQLTELSEKNSIAKEEVHRIGSGMSDTSPLQVSD